jgi:methionine sulfoxide reductase heme-binding subunit
MTPGRLALIKTLVALASLTPLIWLVLRAAGVGGTSLGANPVEVVLHTLGKTALNMLLITLAVTPARQLTGQNWLIRLRRMLGLFCFFYATLHLVVYVTLDQGMAWDMLLVDLTRRPYITVGFLAVLLMLPLAITSTNRMQRRLGRNWLKLHKLIYPAAILAVVHYFWQTKLDVREPLIYAIVLGVLLLYRIVRWQRRRTAMRRAQRSVQT